MSKFDDAFRGLYFRKSKQARLEQAIARIEAAQQKSEQAIAHVETELARIKSTSFILTVAMLETTYSLIRCFRGSY
jgi:hypothetical protein